MDYYYCFANASLSIWVTEYLAKQPSFLLDSVTIIHIANDWLIRTKFSARLRPEREGDFLAVMNEFGHPYTPTTPMKSAFASLASGETPIEVMKRYQIEFIVHGKPEGEDIEFFKQRFLKASGYCPNSLR